MASSLRCIETVSYKFHSTIMLHATIKSLVEAGVLIGAGAFAANLGVFNSLDLQVRFLLI